MVFSDSSEKFLVPKFQINMKLHSITTKPVDWILIYFIYSDRPTFRQRSVSPNLYSHLSVSF